MIDDAYVIKTSRTGKKVFISSTSDDLKDIRAEVAADLLEWSFQPVWSEAADFPIKKGQHKHDACLDAVKECDIYLLIIDRRYGSIYAGSKYAEKKISITWYEARIAFSEKKEIITFVRDVVMTERKIHHENLKAGIDIKLSFVDDSKVFDVIDFVDNQVSDNWIYPFKDLVELKKILRGILSTKKDIYMLQYFDRFKKGGEYA
jgi:hypothetical protein